MDGVEHSITGVGLILETYFLLDGVLRVDIHCSLQGKRVSTQVCTQYDTDFFGMVCWVYLDLGTL